MAVKKVESFNLHETPAINQNEFDVETYLNANWGKTKEVVNNNAEELMQAQKDISTLKEDNKTNKSSIDVLEKSNETINKSLEDIDTKDKKQDEDIKASKESIEALQTENIEIQTENERLREDIKSIAVVNEVSGENIHVEDSSDARCELEIGGNHVQETREGYNLLNNTLQSQTINGLKVTVNKDKSVTVVGTATANTNIVFDVHNKTIEAGTYTLKDCRTFIENTENKGWWNDGETRTFTNTATLTDKGFFMFYSSGTVVNETLYPMLIKGSELKPYEQYGASPSLNYPSPVKSVGNIKNILDMSNAKGGTSGGITCTMNKDGSYQYVGTATSTVVNVWLLGKYGASLPGIFTLEAGTYYINDAYIFDGTSALNADANKKIYTFINEHKITGVRAPAAVVGQEYNETKYPIIIKIDHEISWIPYDYGYAKANFQNKNIVPILNLGTNWEYTDKGIKTTAISGGKDLTKFKLKKGQTIKIGFKMFSKPIQTTTFTWYINNVTGLIESYLNIEKIDLNKIYQRTYTATKDCEIRCAMWGNSNKDIFEFQMWAEYNNLTEYQRYDEQSYLVDVQQPMFKGDTFIRQDGKWYEKHCVKTEIMLTFPTTNIEVCGTFANFQTNRNIAFAVVKNDLKITNVRNDILCDKLKAKDNSMWGGKEDGIQTYINSNKFMISIPFEDIEKNFGEELTINNYSQAFRKYINDNPLKIYYKLAEPELIECTEAQSKVLDEIYNKAHTYKNITNISAESSEVNPIVSLKYLKDAETEHNKLQAQIDEIKQLLSTTETSALLVNNLEKDLRMEVE